MSVATGTKPEVLRALPGDDVRQILCRFADRYDLQMLVQSVRAVARGPVARYADHIRILYPDFCERCATKLCIEMCSGQAPASGPGGVPVFDLWNCIGPVEDDSPRNIDFSAGAGGLHSNGN